jgi:CheY-like chemotaxis protein
MMLHGLAILVIEDAADILDIFVTLLRAEGAEAVGARNGRDALAIASRYRFDIVLSDLGLPDIPGDVLIRSIVADAVRPIRVAVISGAGAPELTRAREAGAEAVFQKPVEWANVVSFLEHTPRSAAA